MAEAAILGSLLSAGFIIPLAVKSVLGGIVLFLVSRFVGAHGGLLAAMGVAFLSTVVSMFIMQTYVVGLLETEAATIAQAVETNLLGLVLSFVVPGAVWIVLVMMLLKVGFVRAIIIAVIERALSTVLTSMGVFVALTSLA